MSLLIPNPNVPVFDPPKRLLFGPGPGNAHPRVHAAMSLPQVGHMDPAFISMAEEVKALLRYVWQTKNNLTIPVSGTGCAAWEAGVANITEAGDTHLTFINGYFGERHLDMASRYGAKLIPVRTPWGTAFSFDTIKAAIEKHKPTVVWICHAETSTGVRQPLDGVGDVCRANGALLMVDTVTSIGGVPLFVDEWKIDVCYAGSQKCLSCPPGIAPVTFGERAIAKMDQRKGKVPNWYLDMSAIKQYLAVETGAPRVYHHTAPVSMVYALREALTILAEEGLEASWKRHQETAEFFWDLLEKEGFELLVEKQYRLPSLTTVKVPAGVDAGAVNKFLREECSMEIGGAFGQLAGKVWRIGLMGYNSRKENAILIVAALKQALAQQGYKPKAKL